MVKTIKTKARVKVLTEFGYWCLAEIRGLKEDIILEGRYNPVNKAFDFSYNGWKSHATLTPLAKQDCPPLATI